MSTLYISDLDGTLLNPDAQLDEECRARLNALTARGVYFTIATGRSHHSTGKILSGVDLTLPAILLNGALRYDTTAGRVISLETLSQDKLRSIIRIFDAHGIPLALYTYDARNEFHIYYRMSFGLFDRHHGANMRAGDPRYRKTDDYEPCITQERCFFISTLGTPDELLPVQHALETEKLTCQIYEDIYTGGYFLEYLATDKGSAAISLRQAIGADRLVAFGDNLNDLPLLRVADVAVAVRNAIPEVLSNVNEIVEAGIGVIEFIERDLKKK